MSTAFLNNEFLPLDEARISPLDRGFLFADGIYEVIPAFAGTCFRLAEHLQRLQHSLDAIALANPYSDQQWQQILQQLIDHNGGGNQAVYLQVTRGAPQKRDHAFPAADLPATVFAMSNPMAETDLQAVLQTAGGKAITQNDIRWSRCDIKSVSLLANILLRQNAVAVGAQEAILLREGFAIEGAASNLFIVKDGCIQTPPKSHLILGGITRDLILEIAEANALDFSECEISENALRQADEIWCTSSTREILPIISLDGQAVGDGKPGPVWQQMAKLYWQFKQELCQA